MSIEDLSRRQVRYWLFRFKTEAQGGAKAKGAPRGLKKRFENMTVFQLAKGWLEFGVKWDVAEENPFNIVILLESLESAWNRECLKNAKPLPIEQIVSEYSEKKSIKPRDVVYDADISPNGTVIVTKHEVQ